MLQEVLAAARPRRWHVPLIITHGAEQLKGGLEVVSDLADGCQVTTPVAVVGRTPDGDHVLVGKMIFISLVHELMSSCNQRQVVDMTELIGHTITEKPSYKRETHHSLVFQTNRLMVSPME